LVGGCAACVSGPGVSGVWAVVDICDCPFANGGGWADAHYGMSDVVTLRWYWNIVLGFVVAGATLNNAGLVTFR